MLCSFIASSTAATAMVSGLTCRLSVVRRLQNAKPHLVPALTSYMTQTHKCVVTRDHFTPEIDDVPGRLHQIRVVWLIRVTPRKLQVFDQVQGRLIGQFHLYKEWIVKSADFEGCSCAPSAPDAKLILQG